MGQENRRCLYKGIHIYKCTQTDAARFMRKRWTRKVFVYYFEHFRHRGRKKERT